MFLEQIDIINGIVRAIAVGGFLGLILVILFSSVDN